MAILIGTCISFINGRMLIEQVINSMKLIWTENWLLKPVIHTLPFYFLVLNMSFVNIRWQLSQLGNAMPIFLEIKTDSSSHIWLYEVKIKSHFKQVSLIRQYHKQKTSLSKEHWTIMLMERPLCKPWVDLRKAVVILACVSNHIHFAKSHFS